MYVVRSTGKGLSLRVSGGAAGAEGIAWSPDGASILFSYSSNDVLGVPFPKGTLRMVISGALYPAFRAD